MLVLLLSHLSFPAAPVHRAWPRREVLQLAGAAGALGVGRPALAAGIATVPKVTDRVFLDLRIIQRYDVEVLEDASVRGRLTIGLFGDDAPLGVKKFLSFIDGNPGSFAQTLGGPSYASGAFYKLQPGVQIEGGRSRQWPECSHHGS